MDCSLTDVGYSGPKFTWCNKQDPDCHVKCRLDRAAANGAFTGMFDGCGVENLIATSLDHYPMLVLLGGRTQQARRSPVQQGFRYEEMWLLADDYRETLERVWVEDLRGGMAVPSLQVHNGPNLKHVDALCDPGARRPSAVFGSRLGAWSAVLLPSGLRLPLHP
uniref:Uncharacterized protein n=1 Tax=Triticum urartu TaxID=4572 RepID=A0A8R7R7F6_TRIUA